jgi:Zn finger protein HypA/HybF involved in hydrogenase expression
VRVGDLSAVEPELLQFAWEAVVADGPDEGARLDVEVSRASQVCGTCGVVTTCGTERWVPECPQCGAPLHMEGGRQLELISVTYDERSLVTEARS